jgi:hypothetical protein
MVDVGLEIHQHAGAMDAPAFVSVVGELFDDVHDSLRWGARGFYQISQPRAAGIRSMPAATFRRASAFD